jgi:hypothetical protein
MGDELYIRKPAEVQAYQYTGFTDSKNKILEWLNDGHKHPVATYDVFTRCIAVNTHRGFLHAVASNWIVKDSRGDLYVLSEATFEATYTKKRPLNVYIDPSFLSYRSNREILEFID